MAELLINAYPFIHLSAGLPAIHRHKRVLPTVSKHCTRKTRPPQKGLRRFAGTARFERRYQQTVRTMVDKRKRRANV